MDTYLISSHGTEECYEPLIKLNSKEKIIMLCIDGCILYVKNLLDEFIYKHLIKAQDSEELINLLLNPEIKGQKYEKLNFLKNIFCLFEKNVPEMKFDHDETFLSGLFELPLISEPKGYDFISKNPDTVEVNSYHLNFEIARLSEIIKIIRKRNVDDGFLLVLLTCRSYDICKLEKTKLNKLKSNKL